MQRFKLDEEILYVYSTFYTTPKELNVVWPWTRAFRHWKCRPCPGDKLGFVSICFWCIQAAGMFYTTFSLSSVCTSKWCVWRATDIVSHSCEITSLSMLHPQQDMKYTMSMKWLLQTNILFVIGGLYSRFNRKVDYAIRASCTMNHLSSKTRWSISKNGKLGSSMNLFLPTQQYPCATPS